MDSIDTSIGLSLTLPLLEQYHRNGILQAAIPRMPGIRGMCIASIEIVAGKVLSCTLENSQGQRQSIEIAALVRLDKENGPFEWRFYPLRKPQNVVATPPPQTQELPPQARPVPAHAVPYITAPLNLDSLTTWSPQQKRTLYHIYSLVDGRRTVQNIEMSADLPVHITREILVILIRMKVIRIMT